MVYNAVIPITAFGLCLLLAGLVLARNYRSLGHRLFAVFLIGLALWGIFAFAMRSSPDAAHAWTWQLAITFSVMLSSITFLHFSFLYTHRRPVSWVLYAGYGQLLLLTILYHVSPELVSRGIGIDDFGFYPVPGPVTYIVSLSMYAFFIWGLVNFIKAYRSSNSYEEKNSFTYVIGGVCCFLLGGFTDLASIYGVPIPPVAIVGNLLFGILASIAMLRYHLLDIRLIVRRGASYLVVSLIIAIPYVMVIVLIEDILAADINSPWEIFPLIVLLAGLLQPAWSWAQKMVDKLFYRGNYDYLQALASFGREAQNITDIQLLGSTLVELTSKALRLSGGCLLLPSSSGDSFQMSSCYGFETPGEEFPGLAKHSPLIQWIRSHDEPVFRQDLDVFSPLLAMPQSEKEALQKIKAELLVPVKTREKELVGILILRPKLSRQLYSKRDQQLALTIVSQTAMSLENARLYQELKNSYDQLMSAQEHLIRAERLRAIGQMASGIAHDFNNALTGILGRAQLALEEESVAEARRHLQIIEKASLDAAQVIRRLQDFARVRTDQVFGTVDLEEVVKGAMDIIQPRLRQRRDTENAAVEVNIDIGRTRRIRGNEPELKEALVNLMINALEAMPGKGRLGIRVDEMDDVAVISVSDTGVGIPRDVRDRVFEPFFTTKGSKGLGMGLSVAHSIAKRHGGEINVVSKPWGGSTFSIKLPVCPAEQDTAAPGNTPLHTLHDQSILIIDDDERARNVLFETLNRTGLKVDTASCGKTGLEAIRQKGYDLVITDLGMPDISGQEVARSAKSIHPGLPVLLITGWGMQIDAADAGVDGIITKPFERNEILIQIERLLEQRVTRSQP